MTSFAEAYVEFFARASIIATAISFAATIAVVAYSLIARTKKNRRKP